MPDLSDFMQRFYALEQGGENWVPTVEDLRPVVRRLATLERTLEEIDNCAVCAAIADPVELIENIRMLVAVAIPKLKGGYHGEEEERKA